jgi:uncharacterized protein (DUF2384 family)
MATAVIADVQRGTRLASGFVASLQEPRTPYISPRRVAEALGIQLSRLAEIAGVHRNTLSNPASERLQDRLRDMIRVIMAATELTGDTQKAIFWFRNEPIATLKQQTAAELVAAGHTDAVMLHLSEIVDGANG